MVSHGILAGARLGRCRGLEEEHALAFAMSTHERLGEASVVQVRGRDKVDEAVLCYIERRYSACACVCIVSTDILILRR